MRMSRDPIDPLEIETPSENGDSTSIYVLDISNYMLEGEVCSGIALALAEVLDCDPAGMTPINSVIDCDALQALFQARRYGDLRNDVSVSFPYDIYEVTVFANGRVVLEE